MQKTDFSGISVCLFLLFASFASPASSVMLDSLTGKAQVQRAGKGKWFPVKEGTELHNNDIIRTAAHSTAKLKWGNEDHVYLKEQTQLLVNLHENKKPSLISQHITVFYGAAFFIIREVLPALGNKRYDTKVYSPTSVVAIRGTSFCVAADKESGKTALIVINGTVLTRNILRNVSVFVRSGYQTSIAINTDPIKPSPVLKKDIKELKTWVPLAVLTEEMKKQKEKSQRTKAIISGKLEQKTAVVPFANISTYRGSWDIGSLFAQFMASRIDKETPGMKAVVTTLSAENPVEIGMKEKAHYVVTGEITVFDIVQHAKVTPKADDYNEYSDAIIEIRCSLIDVAGEKVKYDNTISVKSRGDNVPHNTWKEIGKLKCDMNDSTFTSSLIGTSIKRAIDQVSGEIARYLRD
ncbi:MAG: hypothetical protein GF401_06755 [Chitinivibrionales bacterium]|nr:hypothetical protein [Chitinivibrionales bacterium]